MAHHARAHAASSGHLVEPQRPDLVPLLDKVYGRVIYKQLADLNSPEAYHALGMYFDHDGRSELEGLVCVGQMRDSGGLLRDVFLTGGAILEAFSDYGENHTPELFVRLDPRRGGHPKAWDQFRGARRTSGQTQLVLPRFVRARIEPNTRMEIPDKLESHIQGRYIPAGSQLREGGSELLYKFSPQQTWNSDGQSFVVDKTVIERGDPDSPQLSFSGVEIARQHAGFLPSPLYKAIICSAAVKLSDGTCRPWTKEDPLSLPFGKYHPRYVPGVRAESPPQAPNPSHPWLHLPLTSLPSHETVPATFRFRHHVHHATAGQALSLRKQQIYRRGTARGNLAAEE
ncbi:hypothetical protein JCM3766R1_000837 [Sporobolomyces carnicolor]